MEGIDSGIPVVYSTEKPHQLLTLLPLPDGSLTPLGTNGVDDHQKRDEFAVLKGFRSRILPG